MIPEGNPVIVEAVIVDHGSSEGLGMISTLHGEQRSNMVSGA